MSQTIRCTRCNAELVGDPPYCPVCNDKWVDRDVTVRLTGKVARYLRQKLIDDGTPMLEEVQRVMEEYLKK